jgi:hypothetical protein
MCRFCFFSQHYLSLDPCKIIVSLHSKITLTSSSLIETINIYKITGQARSFYRVLKMAHQKDKNTGIRGTDSRNKLV